MMKVSPGRARVSWGLMLLGAVLQPGCRPAQQQLDTTTKPQPAAEEQGVASWYGHPFDGRLTASGQIYNMESLTAAHRTLPFGTRLLVERVDTQAKVEITVNDRGPFVAGRIIDLSHAGASALGYSGTSVVKLHILYKPRARGPESYAVQVGDFRNRPDAEAAKVRLQKDFGPVRIVAREGDGSWRVLAGAEPSVEAASALAARIPGAGSDAFVVLLDPD